MTDDAELLRLYATTRSEPAFAELVRRYIDLVHTAALRRLGGDTHTAADVTQHVFVALARHASALARRPVLVGWLYTATRHAALDALRGAARRRQREHCAQDLHLVNAPAATDDWISLRPLLDDTMDELSEPEREIILLRFFEDRSFAELGAKLALTEDAARMRTTRALEKLRTHLARRGLTSTAAALATALTTQTITAAPTTLAATITSGVPLGTTALTTSSLLLMTITTKTLLTAAALITTLAIGTAVYESRRAEQASRSLAGLQSDRDTLTRKNSALNSRLVASAAELARVSAQQKEATAKFTQSTAPKTQLSAPDREWTIPGYGRATLDRSRATLGLRYARLYHDLSLKPEQIASFENAMAERDQSVVDVNIEAANQGLSADDNPAISRIKVEAYEALNKKLQALLGDSGLTEYRQYEKETKTRDFVAAFAGNLYFSDTPLTANQGAELARALKTATQTKMIPMKDEGLKTIYTSREEIDWVTVTAQTQNILSPSQLAVLKQLADKQRAESEMIRLSHTTKK
jgi:RNA polymerase sigma factor (sigma-70 family)